MPDITLTLEDVKLLQKVITDFEREMINIRDAKILLNRINSKLSLAPKKRKPGIDPLEKWMPRVKPQEQEKTMKVVVLNKEKSDRGKR